MMNRAVEQLDTSMVLLLNNDMEVISEEWLEALLDHAQRPEVAALGARPLLPTARRSTKVSSWGQEEASPGTWWRSGTPSGSRPVTARR